MDEFEQPGGTITITNNYSIRNNIAGYLEPPHEADNRPLADRIGDKVRMIIAIK